MTKNKNDPQEFHLGALIMTSSKEVPDK